MVGACGNRIIVKVIDEKEEKKGLLIVPNKREQVRAEIIACGDDVDRQVLDFSYVIILNDTGVEFISSDGQKYLSITEPQIIALEEYLTAEEE
jgi:co-chaperonin GroES (HSP10)